MGRKNFRFYACMIGAALGLATQAVAQEGAPQSSCKLKLLSAMDFRTQTSGTITVPVKVEDKDAYFLVDTGGSTSTIDPFMANKFQMRSKKSDLVINMVGGYRSDKQVNPKDFAIGPMHSPDLWFFVMPSMDRQVSGQLAPNLLRNFDLDFDFAGGKLNLFSQDHCPGKVVYWNPDAVAVVPMKIVYDGHIEIPVSVDGKQIPATVDTGASFTMLPMYSARRYLHISPQDPALIQHVQIINGRRTTVYEYPFKSLAFEGVAVANPYIVIVPDGAAVESDLILGMPTLRQLHLYVAYKENNLYISPAISAARAPADGAAK
jgi:predicted aspartyl protease